jgi:hypothetical protein
MKTTLDRMIMNRLPTIYKYVFHSIATRSKFIAEQAVWCSQILAASKCVVFYVHHWWLYFYSIRVLMEWRYFDVNATEIVTLILVLWIWVSLYKSYLINSVMLREFGRWASWRICWRFHSLESGGFDTRSNSYG